ncbi:MAG: hypothetical protein MUF10_04600 [Thermoanaerobaculaceae bacterium]|nr:hypothetical protein [Thermoanaerobaculaceae bacterium]
MRYHHVGIPTSLPREGEIYLAAHKTYVQGFSDSPYGVEWLRFEPGASTPELVQKVPHVAFEVDDLDAAIAGQEVLIAPNSPSAGVRVAFIVHNGAPIEFLEFDDPNHPDRHPER